MHLRQNWRTVVVLLVGLLHGLVYVFVVPPWQHYDEPAHFEYAWLIAYKQRLPTPETRDPVVLRALMHSMAQHRFYDRFGGGPNADELSDDQLAIGYSQLGDSPGYYILAAPAIALLHGYDVGTQLIGARLVSLALLMTSAIACLGLARELTNEGSPIRWLAPLFMALLPSFVDFMTACNDMVGMIAAASLMMWCCARLVQKGWGWRRANATLLSALVCVGMGSLAMAALVSVPPTLVFAVFGAKRRGLAWVIILLGGLAVSASLIGIGDVAYWYRGTLQTDDMRAVAADGNIALRLVGEPGKPLPRAVQLLAPQALAAIAGRPVVLSGRAWASHDLDAQLPTLNQVNLEASPGSSAGLSLLPAPFSVLARPISGTESSWIELNPFSQVVASPVTVFYDDLALTLADDASNQNLLRNSGMSARWPRIRPWETNLRNQLFWGVQYFDLFLAPLDWAATGGLYQLSAGVLFRSFWLWFGWGHVRAPEPVFYLCGAISVASLIGATLSIATQVRKRRLPAAALVCIGVGCAAILFLALNRGLQSLMYPAFIPVARYMYPAISVVGIAMTAGATRSLFFLPSRTRQAVLISAMLVLSLAGLSTVWAFFRAS